MVKGKGQSCPCTRHKTYNGSGGIPLTPLNLNHDITGRRVSVSRPDRFDRGERAPVLHE